MKREGNNFDGSLGSNSTLSFRLVIEVDLSSTAGLRRRTLLQYPYLASPDFAYDS